MRTLFVLATLVAFASQSFAQNDILIGDVPVPSDVRINDSGSSPFIGVWTGRWDSWRNHILVVDGADDDGRFNVVYSVGRGPHGGGNWFRTEARVDGNTLVFTDNGFAARYSISSTGRLRGIHPNDGHFAILEPQSLSEVLAAPSGDWFNLGQREILATGLKEDGENVGLAVAVYVPSGDGPFRLRSSIMDQPAQGQILWTSIGFSQTTGLPMF